MSSKGSNTEVRPSQALGILLPGVGLYIDATANLVDQIVHTASATGVPRQAKVAERVW